MALRNIVKKGDDILSKRCRVVTDFNDRLHQLLDDMKETLEEANGVGLAGPQVGVLRRVVLVLDGEELLELINPEIIAEEGEQEGFEGCLSVPGYYGVVKRPMTVTVRAQDRNGNWFERTGTELTARAFCHELEHLEGHLFLERAEKLLSEEELDAMMEEQEAAEEMEEA